MKHVEKLDECLGFDRPGHSRQSCFIQKAVLEVLVLVLIFRCVERKFDLKRLGAGIHCDGQHGHGRE